jgi:uncharacterized protein YjiS (DUF1127 family)
MGAETCRPSSRSADGVSIWRRLAEMVLVRRRRARLGRLLSAMTERELLDFGLSRSDVEYELKKPVPPR